ncbi:PAS domain-containing sensor histidine kinase [Halorientalis salina]|uniref:PAS domain-containing sensor histidine kinase n=1 Tax=Halorientalis salina TaxID=2932266 RepID=UPI00145E9196|nr:PAS domain S-box protein [Halorientalis salina]
MEDPPPIEVLLDHAQDKVVLLDGEGRFKYANGAVERILGYEPADLIGENAFEYIHPDDVDEAETAFERTITSETFTETMVEYRFRAEDGSWVWLESQMSNLTDEDLDGYVVSSRDISDRVTAERSQAVAARRLRELAATTDDVLWMFDSDWTELLFVNHAYEAVYGLPIEEIESDPRAFVDAVHPDDVPLVEEAMARLSDGRSVDIEYRVNPAEDYDVWVWVQAIPVVEDSEGRSPSGNRSQTDGGEVVRITGFTRDITDRRQRERQLYVMDNLLRHNLRNDLTTITCNAELIEQQVPEVAEQTATIRRTSASLLASAEKERKIIDLLTTEATHQRVEIDAAVETAAEIVEDRFPAVSIELPRLEPATVVAVAGIEAAILELIENAVQHSECEGPTVRVTARRNGQQVVVRIEDEAPPIPEVEARVLTGEHEMNAVYHSSGLGLWLVYWVVELSDGEITVTSAGDRGNRIEIELPRGHG